MIIQSFRGMRGERCEGGGTSVGALMGAIESEEIIGRMVGEG